MIKVLFTYKDLELVYFGNARDSKSFTVASKGKTIFKHFDS